MRRPSRFASLALIAPCGAPTASAEAAKGQGGPDRSVRDFGASSGWADVQGGHHILGAGLAIVICGSGRIERGENQKRELRFAALLYQNAIAVR